MYEGVALCPQCGHVHATYCLAPVDEVHVCGCKHPAFVRSQERKARIAHAHRPMLTELVFT